MVTHQTACLFNRHITLLEDSVTQRVGRLGSGLGTRALNLLIILSHVYQSALSPCCLCRWHLPFPF